MVDILLEIAQLREILVVPGHRVREHLAISARFQDCILQLDRLSREVFLIPEANALHVELAARIHKAQIVLQLAIAVLDHAVQRMERGNESDDGRNGVNEEVRDTT